MFQFLSLLPRKRTVALLIAAFMLVSFVPAISVFAETVDTGVEGLVAATDVEGIWTYSDGAITGSILSKEASSNCNGKYESQSALLQLNNDTEETCMLSFRYRFERSSLGGSYTISDSSYIGDEGVVSILLGTHEHCQIDITSSGNDMIPSVFVITEMRLTPASSIDLNCLPAEHGSYSAHGESITPQSGRLFSVQTTELILFSAQPEEGYKLQAWYNAETGECISAEKTIYLSFAGNTSIKPVFVAETVPLFRVGKNIYTDLAAAANFAVSSGNEKITLISGGVLPAGDYTVPEGKTLLIPHSVYNVPVKESPQASASSYTKPSIYLELAMDRDANITVETGACISVAGSFCAIAASISSSAGEGEGGESVMTGGRGQTVGPVGCIKMESESSITVSEGGALYAWGYIYGDGSVTVTDGGTVYEAMQILDWRGAGDVKTEMEYVFPFNQYFIQNIEVPLTLEAGATEKVCAGINEGDIDNSMMISYDNRLLEFTFVGDDGMLSVSTGQIVKDYVENKDRLRIDVKGNVSVNPVTMTTTFDKLPTIDTERLCLPIHSGTTVNVISGTLSTETDVELLPGAELIVGKEGQAKLHSSLYVYDLDDWGGCMGGRAKAHTAGFSMANGSETIWDDDDLTDATLDVNGKIDVLGALCSSSGGANIISSLGKGIIDNCGNAPSHWAGIVNELDAEGQETTVGFGPAILTNGENRPEGRPAQRDAADCAPGDIIFFSQPLDMWLFDGETFSTITFDYIAPGGATVSGSMDDLEIVVDAETWQTAESLSDLAVPLPKSGFKARGYRFSCWTYDPSGSSMSFGAEAPVFFTSDTTLYEEFEKVENGYYLVGSETDWDSAEPAAHLMFELNPNSSENEYMLDIELAEDEEFKVIYYNNGDVTWYPDMVSNYTVDAGHAGEKTVYFRPGGNGGSDWYYSVIYVAPNSYTVTVQANDDEMGTVGGGGEYAYASEVALTAEPNDGYYFTGWQVEDEAVTIGEDNKFTMPAGDVTVTAVFAEIETPKFVSHSLLLGGEIGVKFYMDLSCLDESALGDCWMEFTVQGEEYTTEFDGENMNPTGDYYGFTCRVNALQMAEDITAVFHYTVDGEELTVAAEQPYSVWTYIDNMLAKKEVLSDETVALLKAIADYGAYAQEFLAEANGFTIGEDYAEMTAFTGPDELNMQGYEINASEYAIERDAGSTGIEKITFSLDLLSATSIKVYLKPGPDWDETYDFGSIDVSTDDHSLGDDEWEQTVTDTGRYLITIKNIPAHKLGDTFMIEAVNFCDRCVVRVSALSYVNAVLNAVGDSPLNTGWARPAAVALWNYYQATVTYMNSLDNG